MVKTCVALLPYYTQFGVISLQRTGAVEACAFRKPVKEALGTGEECVTNTYSSSSRRPAVCRPRNTAAWCAVVVVAIV
eukprot:scaffold36753_cov121-Phaeocystis_antarctica.AAC.1